MCSTYPISPDATHWHRGRQGPLGSVARASCKLRFQVSEKVVHDKTEKRTDLRAFQYCYWRSAV